MNGYEHSPEVNLTFHLNGTSLKCLDVAGEVETFTGYSSKEFLSESVKLSKIFHPHDNDIYKLIISKEQILPSSSLTFRIIQKSGHVKIVRATIDKLNHLKVRLQDPVSLREDIVDTTVVTNFTAMMETTDDFIYFKDRNHVFTGASQTLVKVTDPTSHWTDLIGKTDYDVFPREYADIYYTLEKKVFSGLLPVAQEIQPTEDVHGKKGWVDNRKYPIKDVQGNIIGLFGIARDITRLINAEDLAKQSQLMSTILNSTEDAIITCDANGNTTMVNRAARDLLGISDIPTSIYDWELFIHNHQFQDPASEPASKNPLLRALKGETYRNFEINFEFSGGQRRWGLAHGNPLLNTEGHQIGAIVTINDITDRIIAENKLKNAMNEVELATKAKSAFLASMSHEIRTPLHSVLGLTDILLEGNLTEEQKKLLKVSKAAGENLLYLINDILDLSRVEADSFKLNEISFSLSEEIKNCLLIISTRAEEKNLEVTYKIDPDLDKILLGDPIRLRQIILNLLSNAVKFSERGIISIEVKPNGNLTNSDLILFSVKDEGQGIPEEQISSIFERFTQVDSSINRRMSGSGLGLAISKKIVEMMHGKIWVHSRVNEGSTFYFTIQLRKQPNAENTQFKNPKPVTKTKLNSNNIKSSLTILLVDDSKVNRLLIELYLQDQSHVLIHAENGLDALEKFKIHSFDLIFMDVQMPIMDGYAATREIRHWERINGLKEVPILALTANAFEEDALASKQAGCNEHLAKPLRKEDFLNCLKKYSQLLKSQF